MGKAENLTKKEKIKKYGEVFTPNWLVRDMCDMLERESPEAFRPEKTFLEPTCGEGVFVCEILQRKFANCRTEEERRTAVKSVWAMELQADNVEKTIRAVTELCEQNLKLRKEDREIIRSHIIQADAMKVMGMMNELNQMEGGGPVFVFTKTNSTMEEQEERNGGTGDI